MSAVINFVIDMYVKLPTFDSLTSNTIWDQSQRLAARVNKTHNDPCLTQADCTIDVYKQDGNRYYYPAFLHGIPKPGVYRLAIKGSSMQFNGWLRVSKHNVEWWGYVSDHELFFGYSGIESNQVASFNPPAHFTNQTTYRDSFRKTTLDNVLRSMDA